MRVSDRGSSLCKGPVARGPERFLSWLAVQRLGEEEGAVFWKKADGPYRCLAKVLDSFLIILRTVSFYAQVSSMT